jgi:ubiquinone/menaquinone biosynthesis C-methylase UbiE
MDSVFAGTVPRIYDQYLVPLIFQPYATDIAARVEQLQPSHVLEIACGTGVVTRALGQVLSPDVQIVATDLNQTMLDYASSIEMDRPVEWRQADAMQLPFDDGTFDVVVCQFAAMFFSDKPKAFSEAWRVLQPGGNYLFNVWDRIEENEFADVVTTALASVFPDDPPRFMARTPHGYHDTSAVQRDLASGGFEGTVHAETIAERSVAPSPRVPAIAYCHGTPLRDEIFARGPSRVDEATGACEKAIVSQFGNGVVDGKIQAHVILATKS